MQIVTNHTQQPPWERRKPLPALPHSLTWAQKKPKNPKSRLLLIPNPAPSWYSQKKIRPSPDSDLPSGHSQHPGPRQDFGFITIHGFPPAFFILFSSPKSHRAALYPDKPALPPFPAQENQHILATLPSLTNGTPQLFPLRFLALNTLKKLKIRHSL